jgi:hypothetical protein
MMVKARTTQQQGCPTCNTYHQTSKTEAIIKEILNRVIGGFEKVKLHDIKWKNGIKMEIDMFNEQYGIAIEYDGIYHKSDNIFKADQLKLNRLKHHHEISLVIKIREKGLPKLDCAENQFVITCGKHNHKYSFIIPALLEVFGIIEKHTQLNLNISRNKISEVIKKILPTIHNVGSFIIEQNVFALKYPGLIRYFVGDIAPDPFSISFSSNSPMIATCPKCKHKFSSTPKRLNASMGKCPECLYFVTDICEKNSQLKRWYRKVEYEKSLGKNKPQLSIFYSVKNFLGAGEISPNSHYPTIWDCPFCLGDYKSTVDKQSRNSCLCVKCGRIALTNNEKNGIRKMGKSMNAEEIEREMGHILVEDIEQEGIRTTDFQYEER